MPLHIGPHQVVEECVVAESDSSVFRSSIGVVKATAAVSADPGKSY